MRRLRHPIRAIREPFGTAGLVVAMIALIAALGGTALAAKGALTGKQKKEVETIAKKFAGKPGAAGAQGTAGPAGAKGDTGAAGSNGSNGTPGGNGANGKSVKLVNSVPINCAEGGFTYEVEGSGSKNEVCNGEEGAKGDEGSPWTLNGALPPEKTETGTWSFSGGDSGDLLAAVSFPIPLEFPNFLNFEAVHFQEDADFSTFCEGTPNNPKADPGQFCVYSNVGLEADALFNAKFEGVWSPNAVTGTEEEQRTGFSGAILRFEFTGSSGEEAHGFGSWALTAPSK